MRLWTALVVIVAVVLFAATSVLMARTQQQVRVIGDDAAPQAATAADLYFALSDLDAQVARLVLSGDDDALAATQIDALAGYRDRGAQIDADLQRLLSSGAGAAQVRELLDDLAVYRERVWQALATTGDNHGFYTQATNVLHLRLLPGAERLRVASQERLDRAYARKQTTQRWGIAVAVGLGALLIVMLLAMQVWMARRFRRVFNPALVVATILTIVLAAPAAVVLAVQGHELADARAQSLNPFLQLSQARAVSYDAAADTSRYLISGGLAYYKQDFAAKSAGLRLPPGAALDRWQAYRRDNDKIMGLADAGKRDQAVAALTGIRRGDAAFDFSYFDDAVDRAATARRTAFDDTLHSTRTLLTGWTEIPLGVAVLVLTLIPLGVRRRFAEYR